MGATRRSSMDSRRAQHETQLRIDTVRPRQRERRTGPLLRACPRRREDLPKQLAVVAVLQPTGALEGAHLKAELLGKLEVRHRLRPLRPRCRSGVGQALSHACDRIERLPGGGTRRRGLQVRGTVTDAERLRAGTVAQKTQHRASLSVRPSGRTRSFFTKPPRSRR